VTIFLVWVGKWSDGTAGSADLRSDLQFVPTVILSSFRHSRRITSEQEVLSDLGSTKFQMVGKTLTLGVTPARLVIRLECLKTKVSR